MCLRRFIYCRENHLMIRLDNGSNFIGVSVELILAFQEIDHSKVNNYLEKHGREWIIW